jgi:hypothetical protein
MTIGMTTPDPWSTKQRIWCFNERSSARSAGVRVGEADWTTGPSEFTTPYGAVEHHVLEGRIAHGAILPRAGGRPRKRGNAEDG